MQRTVSTLIVALMAGSFALVSPGGEPIALAGDRRMHDGGADTCLAYPGDTVTGCEA